MQRPARKSGACGRFYRYGKPALLIPGEFNPFHYSFPVCTSSQAESESYLCIAAVPRTTDKTGWRTRNRAVAHLWTNFTDDQKLVFKDPYFWALAGLPDPNRWIVDDDEDWEDEEEDDLVEPVADVNDSPDVNEAEDEDEETPAQVAKASAVVPAPPVHQLTASEEAKLRPIFEELVDHARIQLNYGKPVRGPSVNNLVAKGQAAFKQAHAHVSLTILFHLNAFFSG